jgi:uncharacterized membrane protein
LFWTTLFGYFHLLAAGACAGLLLVQYWLLGRPPDRAQLRLQGTAVLGYLLGLIATLATGLACASLGGGMAHYLGQDLFRVKLGLLAGLAVAAVATAARVASWGREARAAAVFAPRGPDLDRFRNLLVLQLVLIALLPLPGLFVARGPGP